MPKPRFEVIVPDSMWNSEQILRAATNTLDNTALAMQTDFETTTATWEHEVKFAISKPSDGVRTVTTDDKIYGYVNKGTEPHIIRPKRARALTFMTPYRAKTRPAFIGSKASRTGNTIVWTRQVQHPGTKARNFDQAIAKKWRKEFPILMQHAINAAAGV